MLDASVFEPRHEKSKFWFPTWSDTNQAVQLQKMARALKFWIKKVEGLYYLKAWSHRRTDMYRKENGLKYAEFGYPVTKFISSVAQSSRDRYVEPGS